MLLLPQILAVAAVVGATVTSTAVDSEAAAVGFTQARDVFGVSLFATSATPAAALDHAACVMDQRRAESLGYSTRAEERCFSTRVEE